MSTPTVAQPRTTARAATLVAVVGILALTAHEPMVGVGATTGAVLALAVVRASSGDRHALPAAMLTAGIVGALATLVTAVGGQLVAVALTVVAVVLGIGTATLLVEGTVARPKALERVGFQGMLVTTVAFGISALAGRSGQVESLLFLGPGVLGLAVLALAAGISVTGAVVAAPPALFPFTDNRDSKRVKEVKQQFAVLLGAVSVVGSALLAGVLWVGVVPTLVTESVLLRFGLLAIVGVGIVLGGIGWYARWSWYSPEGGRDPVVPVSVGTVSGVVAATVVIAALGGPSVEGGWLSLYVLAIPTFGVGWYVLTRYRKRVEEGSPPSAATVTAVALAVSGVLVATTIPSDAPTGTGTAGLAAIGAIATGFFVQKAGAYGRGLGQEVGATGVTQRPQLIRLGWLGGVVGVGFVVAVGTIWVATVFAPTLSAPATASTLAGCAALVAGVWLLLD